MKKRVQEYIPRIKHFLYRYSVFFHLWLYHHGVDYRNKPNSPNFNLHGNNNGHLLIVGMVGSPHLHEWLRATKRLGIFSKITIFPSDYPDLRAAQEVLNEISSKETELHVFQILRNSFLNRKLYLLLDQAIGPIWRSFFLYRLLKRQSFSVVHFHELQHGAYLYNFLFGHPKMPDKHVLICSTWGSDLSFYRNVKSEQGNLQKVFEWTHILTAERVEEIEFARFYSPTVLVFAPIYITVGVNGIVNTNLSLPSTRKAIIVKGYQDLFGRALNVIEVLQRISSQLSGYRIYVYVTAEPVRVVIESLQSTSELDIEIIPWIPKKDLKEFFNISRIFIGQSISDGMPSSLIEAMSSGTFPIQSENSGASLLIENGKNGFLTNPWDLTALEDAILTALQDDNLVDTAQAMNARRLAERFSFETGLSKIGDLYVEALKLL